MNLSRKEKDAIFSFLKKVEVSLENFVSKHYIVLMVLIFLISFFVKFLVFDLSNILGADYGAYLKWADVLRGLDVVGKGLRYPPLYPILLNAFLICLDEITALKACAAFVYSIIVIPYFLLAKKMFGGGIFPVIVSLLIAFNAQYSEMIAWGGNANILGLAFLTAFLIFWTDSLKGATNKKKFLAAFLASLAVGSHYLLAAYLVLFFFIFFFFAFLLLRKNKGFREIMKTVLAIGLLSSVLSVPYIFSYKWLLNSAIFHETSFSLADQNPLYLLINLQAINLFSIALLALEIFGILIMILEGDKLLGLTLASLFISGCLPIFFTLHPARWVYFWPIPLSLGLPAFIRKMLSKLRKFRLAKLAFIAGITVLISAYVTCSIYHMYDTISYYGVLSPQVVFALEYLKRYTEPDSIIATSGPYRGGGEGVGHNYGWWIEGYADRKSVSTSYLRFLIYYDEREIAEKANILFSGTDVLLNDFVMIAETFPAGLGNPEIGINIGDFYEKLLFFADNRTIITYGQNTNVTLSEIKSKISLTAEGKSINLTYSLGDSTAIEKSMCILGDSNIEVSFRINQDVNITKIFIPIFKSDFVSIDCWYVNDDKNISLDAATSIGAHVHFSIVLDYDGEVKTEMGKEFVNFNFERPRKTIRFKFILPKLVSANSNVVKYFNAYDLIEQLEIDYFMININRRREFEWFSRDRNHFLKTNFNSDDIAIFKVIKP